MTIPLATVQSALRTRRAINSMVTTMVGDGCRLHNALVISTKGRNIKFFNLNRLPKAYFLSFYSIGLKPQANYIGRRDAT